jgi:hypothetical protein
MGKVSHYKGPSPYGLKPLTSCICMPYSKANAAKSMPINLFWAICDHDKVSSHWLTKAIWHWLIDRHIGKPKSYITMYAQSCDGRFRCGFCDNWDLPQCAKCKYH